MSETVRVQFIRSNDAADLLDDACARGFDAQVESLGPGPSVLIGPGRNDPSSFTRDLWLALEEWIGRRSLPLVPTNLGKHDVLLRTPIA